jgi:hemoglobin-like flavoprotein
MALNAKLLRAHFETLRPRGDELVKTFYEVLFEGRPEVRAMFKTEMGAQRKKFLETLELIVQNLETPDALLSQMLILGNSHVDYGVKTEHYPIVGAALVEALRRASGPSWTAELDQAWRDAYAVLAQIMKKGGALHRPR